MHQGNGGLRSRPRKSVCPCVYAQLIQSCSTLCDPMDCSPPSSSVHGILQARILQWVAMPSSRGSSQPRDQPHVFVSCIDRWILYHGDTWEALCALKLTLRQERGHNTKGGHKILTNITFTPQFNKWEFIVQKC